MIQEEGTRMLYGSLRFNPYFNTVKLEDIPGMAVCLQRPEVESFDDAWRRIGTGLRLIRTFVDRHKVVFDFEDDITNDIALRCSRYPSTTPIVSLFLHEYMSHFEYNDVVIGNHLSLTWEEANEFVKQRKLNHMCPHCDKKMNHRLYLEHMLFEHGQFDDVSDQAKEKYNKIVDNVSSHVGGTRVKQWLLRIVFSNYTKQSLGCLREEDVFWAKDACKALGLKCVQENVFHLELGKKYVTVEKPQGWVLGVTRS